MLGRVAYGFQRRFGLKYLTKYQAIETMRMVRETGRYVCIIGNMEQVGNNDFIKLYLSHSVHLHIVPLEEQGLTDIALRILRPMFALIPSFISIEEDFFHHT